MRRAKMSLVDEMYRGFRLTHVILRGAGKLSKVSVLVTNRNSNSRVKAEFVGTNSARIARRFVDCVVAGDG